MGTVCWIYNRYKVKRSRNTIQSNIAKKYDTHTHTHTHTHTVALSTLDTPTAAVVVGVVEQGIDGHGVVCAKSEGEKAEAGRKICVSAGKLELGAGETAGDLTITAGSSPVAAVAIAWTVASADPRLVCLFILRGLFIFPCS